MKKQTGYFIVSLIMMTFMVSIGGGLLAFAADGAAPMTPELAAKAEMVRTQQKQRITPAQRKAAADALKAQRKKVHQARKASGKLTPKPVDALQNK